MWESFGNSLGRALGWGILLQCLVTLAVGMDEPSAGEPLHWRWLRVLADHPLRGALGLGLILRAASATGSNGLAGELGAPATPEAATRPAAEASQDPTPKTAAP